jgi:hypothetical protein
MCRSIKILRSLDPPATREDVSAAALQFVRKVSGYRKPSRANQAIFERAHAEISSSVERLLAGLDSARPPS